MARQKALERTKVVNRRSLSTSKDTSSGEGGNTGRLFRRGNMLHITGQDANGMLVTPGTVQTGGFMFILIVVCLHIFTKGTPYQSIDPLIKAYPEPVLQNTQSPPDLNATNIQ